MSTLTRRGAFANSAAKLPALQAARAQDPAVQQALEQIREWLEVRLGARGDRFERAVTFRDLTTELQTLEARLTALIASAGTTAGADAGAATVEQLEDLRATVSDLRSALEALSSSLTAQVGSAVARAAAAGDFSSNTATSVDSEVVLFSGTGGKTGKRATGTGFAKLAAGVLSVDSASTVRSDLQGDGSAVDQVGFRGVPLTSRSADYTLVMADAGKGTLHPAADTNARTFTIPANASVAFPVGTAHTFVNETSQVVTIAITSDTLTLAGSTTSGSRSLAQNGVATALKVTSTKWIISGAGLT